MSKYIVEQLRAGAPDKLDMWHSDKVSFIKRDNCNLVDYTDAELKKSFQDGHFILPADEGDIRRANAYAGDQSHVLLPQSSEGRVIDYNYYVPKNSQLYKNLMNANLLKVKYPKFKEYNKDEFDHVVWNFELDKGVRQYILKTCTGSGSRGVLCCDFERAREGSDIHKERITRQELERFQKFMLKENCNFILQDVIPHSEENGKLLKCNVDFVIKDGKLIGYKWDVMDQRNQFTNWNNLNVYCNEYTEEVMEEVSEFLVKEGIDSAIMNFECYSNLKDNTWIVEFNWRWSNSSLEYEAFQIDPILCYIEGTEFQNIIKDKCGPEGKSPKMTRYWRCGFTEDFLCRT